MNVHLAAQKGFTECARLLLERGADGNVKSERGRTPLHYAARDGHTEVATLLVDSGADVDVKEKREGGECKNECILVLSHGVFIETLLERIQNSETAPPPGLHPKEASQWSTSM